MPGPVSDPDRWVSVDAIANFLTDNLQLSLEQDRKIIGILFQLADRYDRSTLGALNFNLNSVGKCNLSVLREKLRSVGVISFSPEHHITYEGEGLVSIVKQLAALVRSNYYDPQTGKARISSSTPPES